MEQTQQQGQGQTQAPHFTQPPFFSDAQSKNLIIFSLNPDEVVDEIIHRLKGEELNEKGEWYLDENSKTLVNMEGIKIISTLLRSHLPKNQTLANLRENDVIRLSRSIRLNIIEIMHEHWEKFGVFDEGNEEEPDLSICTQIVLLIDHNIFTNLTRAKDGGESKLIRTVYRSHDQTQFAKETQLTEKTGGFLGSLFKRRE